PPEYGGPEYETIIALGALCDIENLEAIAHANAMCNRLGLDTISAGASIAFAMECTERGILTEKNTDGIDLRFGNVDGMLDMIKKIALRDGFGNILADGVREASQKIGKGSEEFAIHVKGQELAMHDPRGKHGVALGYALSPTGADHIEAPHDPVFTMEGPVLYQVNPVGIVDPIVAQDLGPRKIRFFVHTQQIWNFFNSLGICNFAGSPYSSFTLPMITEAVRAITGWNTSLYELMELGERTITMGRMFNVREGLSCEDDTLPKRLFDPLEEGTPREKRILREDFHKALHLYYEAMGWDSKTGVPTEGRLSFLGLDWLI
ncbi:MAG: aldehyde ferredoxin oxidoreductase C-terminal domain-containing protein, partial [Pseudomonadota bacterium]